MKIEEATAGKRVIYIPHHANGDRFHPDCEHGAVRVPIRPGERSVNGDGSFVFVVYDCPAARRATGREPLTAQATSPEDLVAEARTWP